MSISVTLNSVAKVLELFSLGENSSVFYHPDHTGDEPRLVIFKRRVGSNGSPDKLNVKVVYGELDADGIPMVYNVLVDSNISVGAGHAAAVETEAVELMKEVLDHQVTADFLSKQLIPMA